MAVRLSGMISGMDTESIVKELVAAQRLKNNKVTNKQTTLTWQQDKWKELNTKLYKLYTEDLSKMKLQGNYQGKKVSSSNDNLAEVKASTNAPEGAHNLVINTLASSQYVTGDKISKDNGGLPITASASTELTDLGITNGVTLKITGNDGTINELKVIDTTTLDDFVNFAKDAGLNASFDESQKRLFISSKNSGVANGFKITAKISVDGDSNDLLQKIGLNTALSTVVAASDSEIMYNNAKLTGPSNVISANGLTITLKGKTGTGETISLNVSNDTQQTYDMVKTFIKSYNDIVKEMNTLYNADSARGFDPLTDDEKEAMTDTEVERWETKIKDSILRRDANLGSLLNSMKSSMSTPVEVGSKTYSLTTYGIQTSSDYSEKGLLHIYGNKDDSTYADMEDKLMKALEEDPNTVISVLTKISNNLYETMNDKMKSIPNVRSAYTVYNDKMMTRQQTEYTKRIADLEEKVTAMETRYYKQFTAMEKSLARLEAQSGSLASMLGTSAN